MFISGLSLKWRKAIRLFKESCEIMHKVPKEIPIELLVDAESNAGPCKSLASIGRGSSMKRVSVELSPYRRVNFALMPLSEGFCETSF